MNTWRHLKSSSAHWIHVVYTNTSMVQQSSSPMYSVQCLKLPYVYCVSMYLEPIPPVCTCGWP